MNVNSNSISNNTLIFNEVNKVLFDHENGCSRDVKKRCALLIAQAHDEIESKKNLDENSSFFQLLKETNKIKPTLPVPKNLIVSLEFLKSHILPLKENNYLKLHMNGLELSFGERSRWSFSPVSGTSAKSKEALTFLIENLMKHFDELKTDKAEILNLVDILATSYWGKTTLASNPELNEVLQSFIQKMSVAPEGNGESEIFAVEDWNEIIKSDSNESEEDGSFGLRSSFANSYESSSDFHTLSDSLGSGSDVSSQGSEAILDDSFTNSFHGSLDSSFLSSSLGSGSDVSSQEIDKALGMAADSSTEKPKSWLQQIQNGKTLKPVGEKKMPEKKSSEDLTDLIRTSHASRRKWIEGNNLDSEESQ